MKKQEIDWQEEDRKYIWHPGAADEGWGSVSLGGSRPRQRFIYL